MSKNKMIEEFAIHELEQRVEFGLCGGGGGNGGGGDGGKEPICDPGTCPQEN